MESGDLRFFEAVARLGVMTRAAEELHTVQSNVTARVRALERSLGAQLFERHSAGVTLTDAGNRLLPYARRVSRLLKDAQQAARDDGTPRGPLTIGSLETTAAVRLAPMLASYARACPQVDLSIRPGTTCELVAAVKEGSINGAFVCGPVLDPGLEQRPMFCEELAVFASGGTASLERLISAGEIRIAVLRVGCSYRQRLEVLLARRGVPTPRVMQFGTLETIFACVSAGLGITLMPRSVSTSSRFSERLSVFSLPPSEASVETVFVGRRDAPVSSALAAFLCSGSANFSICCSSVRLGRPATAARRTGTARPHGLNARPEARSERGVGRQRRRTKTGTWEIVDRGFHDDSRCGRLPWSVLLVVPHFPGIALPNCEKR
jgi:DNA-binding transcriptional LysR family regulator